ncbi:bifunctional methylenetetrahydrofolate dehydrogenase/cyclohydrolase, mitochondrial [Neocloeon triangulifer]|uniref:bifunctional methylenetetrahydrofolate dehydrogenase/cyclohydrolase, mitochondrial n=1 Tax=Neocloeon triangulifer TaxID=2078957 RepID=UPI00286F2B92|nr:bifunctional methylenetetrahydrofolate dehydrogenase/cyclohydrolase, mitochondrial [Neocloeon triangulifer]
MRAAKFILTLQRSSLSCCRNIHQTYSSITNNFRPNAQILDGRKLANQILTEVKSDTDQWSNLGHRRPHLTAVLIGEDLASRIYVRNKITAANFVGISTNTVKMSESVSENEVLEVVSKLNLDPNVDGILVQLPLPDHVSERSICNAVVPHKDVDGFNTVNVGRLCLDMSTFVPCTALAVMELLKKSGIKTKGKNAVVCGRSKNVGLPIALLLHFDGSGELGGMDSTVTFCHRYTPPKDLMNHTRGADILIAAAGVPKLITAHMVKPGACVIDIGMNRIRDPYGKTRLVGDVDFNGVLEVAGYLTPVPGGVGPVTVAMLMRNTLLAAKQTLKYSVKTHRANRRKTSILEP